MNIPHPDVAAQAKPLFEEEARQRMLAGKAAADPPLRAEEGGKGEAAGQAAELMRVGTDTVYKAQTVLRHGVPELQQAVEAGQVSVSAAAALAGLPRQEQAAVVAGGVQMIKDRATEARRQKQGRARQACQPEGGRDQRGAGKAAGRLRGEGRKRPGAAPANKAAGVDRMQVDLRAEDRVLAQTPVQRLGRERAARVGHAITAIVEATGDKG